MGAEVGSTANTYQVLAKLAVGGMAEIFLARSANATGVERYVVLKRVLRDKANDTQFVAMFLEEARLAAQLQHANIAQVYDIGKLGDSYFFTMEYVHGETVRSMLEHCSMRGYEIPVPAVLAVLAGTAAGLQHAHDRVGVGGNKLAIVHRDISPSNLIVSYEGIVKIVDFGVAKAATSRSETRSGTIKGKAAYMSPEQARGEPLDRRSDLFALGIVAWEMLTTRRLYTGATDFQTMSSIVRLEVPPPSSVRAGIPPELDALVLRLLAKSREARFQSGDDVIEALEVVATKLGHQLSTKSLGRYVSALFGTRPEPWVALTEDDGLSAVSVTSEPIPQSIAAGMHSYNELQIEEAPESTLREGLATLSAQRPAPVSSTARHTAPMVARPMQTTPMPAAPDELDEPTVAVSSLRDVVPTHPDLLQLVPTLPVRRAESVEEPVTVEEPRPVSALAPGHVRTLFGVGGAVTDAQQALHAALAARTQPMPTAASSSAQMPLARPSPLPAQLQPPPQPQWLPPTPLPTRAPVVSPPSEAPPASRALVYAVVAMIVVGVAIAAIVLAT